MPNIQKGIHSRRAIANLIKYRGNWYYPFDYVGLIKLPKFMLEPILNRFPVPYRNGNFAVQIEYEALPNDIKLHIELTAGHTGMICQNLITIVQFNRRLYVAY